MMNIYIASFIEIPPPSTQILCHVKQVSMNGQQTASCKLKVIPQPENCIWPRIAMILTFNL